MEYEYGTPFIVKRLRRGNYRWIWTTTDNGWGIESIADDGFVRCEIQHNKQWATMRHWTGAEFKLVDQLTSEFAHGRLIASKET
jgi:hypothetical protein